MFLWIILVLLYLLYKWSTASHDYFAKRGIPFKKPIPLFGNVLNVLLRRESAVDIIQRSYYDLKRPKIFGFFESNQSIYVLTDPEIIKRITTKDFEHFTDHKLLISNLDRLFGKTLIGLKGQLWKDMRSTLSPVFTSSKLKTTFSLLSLHAQDFVKHFEKEAGNDGWNEVNVLDKFTRFTADGIATGVLGFEGDCVKEENGFLRKKITQFSDDFRKPAGVLKLILGVICPSLYKAFNLQIISHNTYNFFKRVTIDAMKDRERNNISRPDIIHLMMQARKGQLQSLNGEPKVDKELDGFASHEELGLKTNAKNLQEIIDDDEYWIAQGFLLFSSGYSTTTNLLQSITFHLAKNPAVQEELYREVSEVSIALQGDRVTYEALHKMKFLDMVVSEGLRIQPSTAITDRCCTKAYTMDLGDRKSIEIKKNDRIYLSPYLIHHDSEYFPNPEEFNPLRFSDENKHTIINGSYLPFGLGPRACIGSRFALMEAKLLLFNVLANFRIDPSPRTPKKLTFSPTIQNPRIKETVYLNFKRR